MIEMKYKFTVEESNNGYKKIILSEELKLIEYVFEDMESFGEAIFKSFIKKVINEDSTYEEISGNICSLEIRKEFTTVSAEFAPSEMSSEYKIETNELFSLILLWIDINNSKLN
jgi:hypothetical protein